MQEEKNNSKGMDVGFDDIMRALDTLNEKIEKQEERLKKLESSLSIQKEDALYFETKQENIPISQPPASEYIPKQEKRGTSLEENIGGKWFARIGISALILGISFFLKYAFDNNWVSPTGRVLIGILIGTILLGLGGALVRKYFVYGQVISGGGIAVLYLSIFAAFDFYGIISQMPAFLLMIMITAVGIFLSLRYNAISLFLVSILGGFSTPFLISTGENNEIALFSYILLLDIAILVISAFRNWKQVNVVGFLGTVFIFAGWADRFYVKEELIITMVFLSLFFLTFSFSSLVFNLLKKEKSSGVEQILTLFSAIAYFSASYAIMDADYHFFMGFFSIILAVYYFSWAYLIRNVVNEDKDLYNFLTFLAASFITLFIPIQFDGNTITIGWILEAILLILVGIKVKKDSLKSFGVAVFLFAIMKLLLTVLDSGFKENDLVIFNKIFFTFFLAIAVSYLAGYLFKKVVSENEKSAFADARQLMVMFIIAANFLTIFAISREIVFYFKSEKIVIERSIASEKDNYQNKVFDNYSTNKNIRAKIEKIENKSSVYLSLFWLFYGIILMIVGIVGRYKGTRVGGIVLFALAILKLFFNDLWNLGTFYRIISSISLGIVLLVISFAYQKYKYKIREIF